MTAPNDGSRRITPTGGGATGAPAPVSGQDPTLIRTGGPVEHDDHRPSRPAKTSAAAAFALVFGLAALFCALTAILSPVAVVFGLIGIVLALVAFKMTKKPGVTGKGVAIGGLVTAVLGLVLGGVVLGGLAAVVNDEAQLDRLQGYVDDAREQLPSTDEARDAVPGQ